MRDQAEKLRLRIQANGGSRRTKIVAVVSGKGGVGKSNFLLNFAISLKKQQKNVLLFDMDIGMGNIDILMGKTSPYTIVDFFERKIPLRKVVARGEHVDYIAGGTGLSHVMKLSKQAFTAFSMELEALLQDYDYVVFDMGAGMKEDDLRFILSVHEVIVITLPEPPAIMDAYAAMKHLYLLNANLPLYIVVNRVQNEKEGYETAQRLTRVLKNFLGKDATSLGLIPDDKYVKQAVNQQIPLLFLNERSPAAKAIHHIGKRYMTGDFNSQTFVDSKQFISKLRSFFFERKGER